MAFMSTILAKYNMEHGSNIESLLSSYDAFIENNTTMSSISELKFAYPSKYSKLAKRVL